MSKARQLPVNLEAEMSVLGAIFIDQEKYPEVSAILSPNDFYYEKHKELYSAMGTLALKGQLDFVTLNAELTKRGTLEKIGGDRYILDIAQFTPTSENVLEYARIVKDCAIRRNMIVGYSKAIEGLYNPQKPIRAISDFVQEKVLGESDKPKRLSNFTDACEIFFTELDRRQKSGNKFPGIETGFMLFDRMTGGLENGKLYVIGGRPSMGKTALALNMAANLAMDNKTVMFFSLEMGMYEVTKRIMSYISGVKGGRLKTASLSDNEMIDLAKATEEIAANRLYIEDAGYQTMGSVEATCMRVNNMLKSAGGKIDAVFIDHLHLMSFSGRLADYRHQIGEVTRGCKILADKLDCPVVLLAQLKRLEKERKDKRPILSDLRESGNIEQDADVVAFVHREEYYEPTADNEGRAELILAKVRDGETGRIELGWDKTTTTFMSLHTYLTRKKEKNINPGIKALRKEEQREIEV